MSTHAEELTTGFERLRKDDKYADFTITAGGQDFKCHRIVLAALSPYFEMMFDSDFVEKDQGTVNLEKMGLDEETCSDFLQYLYTGSTEVINNDNAAVLLYAAHLMSVESLHRSCSEFLKKHACKDNCIHVWCVARNQDDTADLAEVARSLILKHFVEIALSDTKLDGVNTVENLIAILDSKNINVVDRVGMFCRVSVSWIDADLDNRNFYIKELCKALLKMGIVSNDIQKEAQNVRTRTREAILKVLEEIVTINPSPMEFEAPADDSMIVMGGNEGGSNCSVMCFSFPQKTWFSLPPLPLDPGFNFAICAHQFSILVSGGSGPGPNVTQNNRGGHKKFLCFDGKKNQWFEFPDLPKQRQHHVMYAFADAVYIFGGGENRECTNIVFKFWYEKQQWSRCNTTLCDSVRSAAHTCIGKKVYLFGGFKSESNKSTSIQCFDCQFDQSYRLAYSLPPSASLHARAEVLNGQILLVCKNGEIAICSEEESVRVVSTIKNFDRKGFGMCSFEDKLLFCGGEVSFSSTKDMFLYDYQQRIVITMQETMPVSASNFSFTKGKVLRDYLVTECKTTMAAM